MNRIFDFFKSSYNYLDHSITSFHNKHARIALIIAVLVICIILSFLPFFISTRKDSLLSIFSLIFTAIGSLASLATLIIALLLYQRFGLESKFVERQTNTVLELANSIKGKVIKANYNEGTYFIRAKIVDIEEEKNDYPYFNDLYEKIITFKSTDDYEESMTPILKFKYDYWLPDEIKTKMEFLEIKSYLSGKGLDDNKIYCEFDFGTGKDEKIILPYPQITVLEFVVSYSNLVLSIESWLKKYCNINIDLKLDQSNIYERKD